MPLGGGKWAGLGRRERGREREREREKREERRKLQKTKTRFQGDLMICLVTSSDVIFRSAGSLLSLSLFLLLPFILLLF